MPTHLARGVPAAFRLEPAEPVRVRVRQPLPPDLELEPAQADGVLAGQLVARRRGRHTLPPPVAQAHRPARARRVDASGRRGGRRARLSGPAGGPPARERVRAGKFRDEGLRRRGPLGLGTEFESVREYSPDDDIRQVNWRATARLGRPMSNQYRIERDRDVVCVVDCGRLMAAPFWPTARGSTPRLDAAVAVARRRRRAGRPLRRDRLRGRGAALPAAAAGRRARRRRGAVRPRARAGRERLRARVRADPGRQARVRARPHRSAGGVGGAAARRGAPGACAQACGRGGRLGRSRPRRGGAHRAARAR